MIAGGIGYSRGVSEMADMNHLVMLHGMTGTSSKMRPLAESLAPHNWGVVCPEGTYVHPRSGRAWWVREELIEAVTPADQILISMKSLEQSPSLKGN